MATTIATAYVQIVPSVQNISTNLDSQLSGITNSANSAESSINSVGTAAGSAEGQLDALGSDVDSAGADLDSLGSDASSAGSELDALGDDASGLGDDIDSFGDDADDAGDSLSSLGDDASDAGSDLDGLGSDADGAGSDLDSLADSADSAADSISGIGDSASGAVDGVEGLGGSLGGTMASGSTEAANAMSGLSSTVEGFKTGGLVGGVVAGIEAIGTGIYNMATETQDASATIAQGTGATGDALEDMTMRAKYALDDVQLASQTDLNSVAETLAETNTRFGLTGDALQETTTRMEDFAGVTGQTGAEAVDALADVIGEWHMETEDMPGLMDQLTAASQASGASASDLEASLSANSAAFNEMGMSMDDSIALMAAFEQAGGNANDMNKVLKSAISNLNGEVDDMPGAFMDAIEAIENADDATDALNAQVGDTGMTVEDVFGTKNANTIIQTCQSSSFSIEDMQDVLENCDGAMEQTAEDSVTFKDKVQGAFNGLKTGVSNAWQNIKGFFTNTRDTGKEAGDGLVEGLSDSADDVEQAGSDVGQAVIDGASDTLETHSPSKVMAGIGGDVTQGLVDGLGDVGEKVGGIFSGVLGNITGFGKDAQTEGSNTGTGFVANIKNGLSNLASTVASPLNSASGEMSDFDKDSTKTASDTGSGFVSNMKTGLTSLANTVASPMKSALSNTTSWGSDMGRESSSSASGFVDKMKTGLSNMSNEVKAKLDPVTQTSSRWGDALATEFNGMGKNVINGIIGGIGSMVGNLYTSIQNSLSGLVGKAKSALGISSPSKVFRDEVGLMIGEGLALGISDSEGEVDSAMDSLLDLTAAGGGLSVSANATGGVNGGIDTLLELLNYYLPQLANMQVVTDTGALVGELASPMNRALGQISAKEARR